MAHKFISLTRVLPASLMSGYRLTQSVLWSNGAHQCLSCLIRDLTSWTRWESGLKQLWWKFTSLKESSMGSELSSKGLLSSGMKTYNSQITRSSQLAPIVRHMAGRKTAQSGKAKWRNQVKNQRRNKGQLIVSSKTSWCLLKDLMWWRLLEMGTVCSEQLLTRFTVTKKLIT